MSNYKEGFENRINLNIAENKAVKFYKDQGIKIIRYGFNGYDEEERIEKQDFFKIPEKMRKLPDYLIITDKAYLLEVKGCNDILRIKTMDMQGYDFWDKIVPIVLFAYSTAFNACYRVKYYKLKELLKDMGKKDVYPDNNKEFNYIEVKELALIGQFCKC